MSGGGNEKQSFLLDGFFFSTLPRNGRFLYIPIALRGHILYFTAHSWMEDVIELHERTDIEFETMDDSSEYGIEALKEFDGIYIGGGNTWSLIQKLGESGFTKALIQYIEFGGYVYGGSAGAIIMGKRIDTHDDENRIELKDMSGLGLLEDFSVACHFEDNQNDRFKSWATSNNSPIICLSEETGLVIKGLSALCVGQSPCFIYLTDGTRKEIIPRESFSL